MVTPPEQRKKRSREKVTVIAAAALVIVLLAGFIILRLAGYKTRVREFRFRLNHSTIYAYNNDCLRADVEGKTVRITGEHAYDVYQFMAVRSLGANALFVPRAAPDVTLTYGDGAVMELWEDPSERGLYLRFTDAGGGVCRFHSRDMQLDNLISRYLAPGKNETWN